MTTTPVMTITDEQIAEIEYYALCGLQASPANILALISRLRAAEKDAERYRWLRDVSVDADGDTVMAAKIDGEGNTISNWMFGRLLDDSIDAAMEQSK